MYDSKPLIRWILGPVCHTGLEILQYSVKKMKLLYPDCNLMICHNQLKKEHIDFIKRLNIDLYEQKPLLTRVPKNEFNVHWKIYPPRVSIDTHEICIDNDIILEDRLEEIDLFLQSDGVLMYQGIHGYYGMYENQIDFNGIFYNSGIFGVPPKYDLEQRIESVFESENKEWSNNKFDEQGLICSILSTHHKIYTIPLTSIPIVEKSFEIEKTKRNPLCKGYHFVGANLHKDHKGWTDYITTKPKSFL